MKYNDYCLHYYYLCYIRYNFFKAWHFQGLLWDVDTYSMFSTEFKTKSSWYLRCLTAFFFTTLWDCVVIYSENALSCRRLNRPNIFLFFYAFLILKCNVFRPNDSAYVIRIGVISVVSIAVVIFVGTCLFVRLYARTSKSPYIICISA